MLPYLDGERTPMLPDATGSLMGLRRGNMTPATIAGRAFEGVLCALADGRTAIVAHGRAAPAPARSGARRVYWRCGRLRRRVFGLDVACPPAEYVANRGAARQAAWALAGGDVAWPAASGRWVEADPTPHVREG